MPTFTIHLRARLVLMFLGLWVIGTGTLLVGSLSRTTVTQVEQQLTNYWRTTYDILVRPTNSRTLIEDKYNLVEANHLSGIANGIGINQYEMIKNLPDIEVAAPIAMFGYSPEFGFGDEMGELSEPGVYLFEEVLSIGDGANIYTGRLFTKSSYFYVPNKGELVSASRGDPGIILLNSSFPYSPRPMIEFPILTAGIDPVQESLLIGLDQSLNDGKYLSENEPLVRGELMDLPVLINSSSYVDVTVVSELKRLILPDTVNSLDAIVERGGRKFLETLPIELTATQTIASQKIYEIMIEKLLAGGRGSAGSVLWDLPGTISYREATAPFVHDGIVLEVVMPGGNSYLGFPAYREFHTPDETDFGNTYTLRTVGTFNIENLPKPDDVNRVPLETYYPPIAILRYDESGQPVEPQILRPTINPAGYIQSPPLALTTLDAVCILVGENCISAIRVRVALEDCPGDYLTCLLTPQNQRKVEIIAGEIARQTGLDVDIMLGSSPTRVLVHVPGIGYVEEQWIQKNVTIAYKERVQAGHLLLLGTLMGVGGLFVLDLAWAEVAARRRVIALQKALGWRSSTVFAQILGQITLVGVTAVVLGVLAAWGVSRAAGWELPSLTLLGGVSLSVAGLALIGGAYPAWLAARLPPVEGLQRGQVSHPGRSVRLPARGVLPFAWMGMLRRWSRTALGALTATLSAALFVLMLSVTVDRQGAMSGTLLGEFVLVRIEGYHYAIVGIGFGLAALSLANSLLAGVLERRREIGVLKAVGWRTGEVARLFLYEGTLIGALGGMVGAVVGAAVFVWLYETVTPNLIWIGLAGAGLPVIVGLLAALYPARIAANVSPAEAVRYE